MDPMKQQILQKLIANVIMDKCARQDHPRIPVQSRAGYPLHNPLLAGIVSR